MAVVFVAGSWFLVQYEAETHKKNMINAFEDEQYMYAVQLSGRVSAALSDYTKNGGIDLKSAEQKVIADIIKKETNTQNKYVFFYDSKNVLFEKDDSTTAKYSRKSISDVYDLWKYNGGSNLNYSLKLISQGEGGNSEVSKSSSGGTEVISWCTFSFSGEKFVVGVSTSEDYLGSITLFSQHVMRMYMIYGIFSVVIVILSAAFSLSIFFTNRKITKLERKVEKRNTQIESYTDKMESMTEDIKKVNICDALTGVYNQQFFYTAAAKMNIDILLPIAVIKVDIDDFKSINNKFGKEKGNDILINMAQIILKQCSKCDIVSRIDDDEFIIASVNADDEAADKLINDIKCDIEDAFKEYSLNVSFGKAIKEHSYQKLTDVVNDAGIDLKLNKIKNKSKEQI